MAVVADAAAADGPPVSRRSGHIPGLPAVPADVTEYGATEYGATECGATECGATECGATDGY